MTRLNLKATPFRLCILKSAVCDFDPLICSRLACRGRGTCGTPMTEPPVARCSITPRRRRQEPAVLARTASSPSSSRSCITSRTSCARRTRRRRSPTTGSLPPWWWTACASSSSHSSPSSPPSPCSSRRRTLLSRDDSVSLLLLLFLLWRRMPHSVPPGRRSRRRELVSEAARRLAVGKNGSLPCPCAGPCLPTRFDQRLGHMYQSKANYGESVTQFYSLRERGNVSHYEIVCAIVPFVYQLIVVWQSVFLVCDELTANRQSRRGYSGHEWQIVGHSLAMLSWAGALKFNLNKTRNAFSPRLSARFTVRKFVTHLVSVVAFIAGWCYSCPAVDITPPCVIVTRFLQCGSGEAKYFPSNSIQLFRMTNSTSSTELNTCTGR